ncbi:MAG: hypothetical protein RIC35_22845 [Marinoscillum sp.]
MNKVILLLISYFGIALVTSCLSCPDVNAFYDFASLEAEYPNGTSISENQDFILILNELEISYLADHRKFSLLTPAHATQECEGAGYLGKKFKIEEIIITSDADWDESHPAGTPLNDVILFGSNIQYSQYLSDVDDFGEFDRNHYFKFTAPTLDTAHTFHIQVRKTNGTSVPITTNLVSWTN